MEMAIFSVKTLTPCPGATTILPALFPSAMTELRSLLFCQPFIKLSIGLNLFMMAVLLLLYKIFGIVLAQYSKPILAGMVSMVYLASELTLRQRIRLFEFPKGLVWLRYLLPVIAVVCLVLPSLMAFIVFIDQPLQSHWVFRVMLVLGTVLLGWATWFLVIMFPRIDTRVFQQWQGELLRKEEWNSGKENGVVYRA